MNKTLPWMLCFRDAVFMLCAASVFAATPAAQPAQGPGGRGAAMALFQLERLLSDAKSQPKLAISGAQARKLLPILKEWQAAGAKAGQDKAAGFAARIEAELSAAQKDYRPQRFQDGDAQGGPPPDGQGGPGNVPGGGRGRGGDTTALLASLIKALQAL